MIDYSHERDWWLRAEAREAATSVAELFASSAKEAFRRFTSTTLTGKTT
jgi:hypothetical protein